MITAWYVVAYAFALGWALGRARLRRTLVRDLDAHGDFYGADLIARGRHRERP